HSECKSAMAFVVLEPVNDLIIVSDRVTAGVGLDPVNLNFLYNNNDPENTGMTAGTNIRPAKYGTFSYLPNGQSVYIPADNAPSITDTIVVEVCDNGFPLPAICKNDTIFVSIKQNV